MPQNDIKSVVKTKCPHCDKPLFIPLTFTAPSMSAIMSEEDVKRAKAAAREVVNNSKLTDGEKNEAIKYINDPDFIFGMEDVTTVISTFDILE